MKTDVGFKWKIGDRDVTFLVSVPAKQKRLATRIMKEVYTNFLVALKAYNYVIRNNNSVE